jgi:hypothetical protein
MERYYLVPDLGEGLDDIAIVVEWFVAVGDPAELSLPLPYAQTRDFGRPYPGAQ